MGSQGHFKQILRQVIHFVMPGKMSKHTFALYFFPKVRIFSYFAFGLLPEDGLGLLE